MNNRAYELVVFDWDGTLMDSAAHITHCMRRALLDVGLPDRPDAELQQVIGLGLHEAVRALVPARDSVFYERLADAYRRHWLSSPPGLSRFFEGMENLLKRLHTTDIMLAVATGKSRRGLDKQFTETALGHVFDSSRCADETASKPAPDMLHEILEELDVPASRALVVGDTEFDMQMAQAAGCDRIAVSYGVHEASRLAACQPLFLFTSPAELIQWFDVNLL